jgi:hypothetical protein
LHLCSCVTLFLFDTLSFGTRAKSIKNRAVVNEEKSESHPHCLSMACCSLARFVLFPGVEEYKRLLQAANTRISLQDQLIRALEKVRSLDGPAEC